MKNAPDENFRLSGAAGVVHSLQLLWLVRGFFAEAPA